MEKFLTFHRRQDFYLWFEKRRGFLRKTYTKYLGLDYVDDRSPKRGMIYNDYERKNSLRMVSEV